MKLHKPASFVLSALIIIAVCALPRSGNAEKGDSINTKKFFEAEKIDKKSLERLETLAKAGNAKMQSTLGFIYFNGKGAPKDFDKALKWSKKAAKQGNPASQHTLAKIYRMGKGVPQDFEKALKWHRKAAKQGTLKLNI